MSIIYVIFGVVAKFTAVFMSIPDPVIGGIILTVLGVFVGVNLANLKVTLNPLLDDNCLWKITV